MDTIFALASAPGKAGVAIIRVSGPDAWTAGMRLAGSLPAARRAQVRNLTGPNGDVLDQALVVAFSSDSSFTGENVVEFHLHGSMAIVKVVLATLGNMDGLRGALPGEFTRQALENQRLDLAQVEGLADLIDAETEAQRRQAMKVLSGELGKKAEIWRSKLIRAAALLEATIDFVDEDVPVNVVPEVTDLIATVDSSLRAEARGVVMAERIRDGFEVAIVGPPNVGKSTLLNALAGRDAAITSEIAGTTRDVIEVRMDLRGLPVTILDTAGLRDAQDAVEAVGVKRAIDRATAADLRVFLSDGTTIYGGLSPSDNDIEICSKVDLASAGQSGVSGKTGQGIPQLVDRIAEILEKQSSAAVTATHERHRLAIERAMTSLDEASAEAEKGPDRAEFAAEGLRSAVRALDSLVGLVDVEHILDEIFSSFCIGK